MGFGAYLSLVVEVPMRPVAVVLIALFTVVNLIGTRETARTEIALVAVLLVLLAYFVISGAAQVATAPRDLAARFQPLFPFGIEGTTRAVALVFVSYGGVGQVASVAGEVRNPSRSIPMACCSRSEPRASSTSPAP